MAESCHWVVALWLLIEKIPGPNLVPETSCIFKCFSLLSSVPPAYCLDSALNEVTSVSFHIPFARRVAGQLYFPNFLFYCSMFALKFGAI